jgi:hypothetical protein
MIHFLRNIFISQANVGEALRWMSRQSALLKFFHEELLKPNPTADLEQKLQATQAAAEKQIQALTKERDILKASQSDLWAEVSMAASNFEQLKLENAKLSDEKKEIQVALSKAQEEVTLLRGENGLISRVKDQLSADNVLLETSNDKLEADIEEQSRLISNGAYMAFASCLKQVEFLNPGDQLTFKGVHPLHGVEGGKLLDYDNDPPTQVDLNDPELEAFDAHANYSMSPTPTEDEDVTPAEP